MIPVRVAAEKNSKTVVQVSRFIWHNGATALAVQRRSGLITT